MEITVDEVAMLLGKKDIEIFTLQKQNAGLREIVVQLSPPAPEPAPA